MYLQDVRLLDLPDASLALAEALQFQLSRSEKLSHERMQQAQLNVIKVLINHAVTHVPYYRANDLYGDVTSWDDFYQLPIIERHDVQKNRAQLITSTKIPGHGNDVAFKSSGSTGQPIHSLSTDRAQLYWRAITLREHLWQQRDLTGKLAIIKNFSVDEARYPGIQTERWGHSTLQLSNGPSCVLNSSETLDVQYQWLIEQQPDYLLTYPSVVQGLMQYHQQAQKPLKLKGISTLGETLPENTRQLTKKVMGCRIADMYSAQEVGYIALQCPQHDHYHIQSEVCLVEVLDDDNQPCAPGQMGRVVVTVLHNFRMPLIRYAIGDYAIVGEPCDCGIHLPTLKRIVGRTRNLVTYPDGRKSWPAYNPMKLMELIPNGQFQLLQMDHHTLQFNWVGDQPLSDDKRQEIIRVIRHAIGHDFNIGFVKKEKIERAASGKFEEFVSFLSALSISA